MKKKLVSLALALVMVLSLLPASALATEEIIPQRETASSTEATTDVQDTTPTDDDKARSSLAAFQAASEKTWALTYDVVLRAQGLIGSGSSADVRDEIKNYLATVKTLTLTGQKKYTNLGGKNDLGLLEFFTGLESLTITDAMADEPNGLPLDLGALMNLTNLEYLDLSGDNIAGQFGSLAACTKLKTLNLSGNPGLTDFGALDYLTELTELNLSGTGFSNKDFDALKNLSKLTSLDISGTSAQDLGGLAMKDNPCRSLEVLDISNTSIKSLDPLMKGEQSAFPALTTLTAKGLELDSIEGLAKAVEAEGGRLTACDMDGSRVTGADGGNHVQAISEELGDSFTAPLADAPTVNDVTKAESWKAKFAADLGEDGGKAGLTWDTLITAVYFYRQAQAYVTGLDAQNAADLTSRVEALTSYYSTGVTKLDMSGKAESKFAISTGTLTDFVGLKELNLSNTGIKDSGGLVGLTALENLNLSGNTGINATHFGALVGLENLTDLDLSGTGVSEIGGLTGGGDANKVAAKLETLNISNTPVTKLDSLWINGSASFPALKNLTANGLSLTSIAGLVEIASAEGFTSERVEWNLGDSELTCSEANEHIAAITAKLENKFTPPTVPEPVTYTIKFAAGEGAAGTMNDAVYPKAASGDTTYTLPDCGFTAPDNKVFKEWTIAPADQGIAVEAATLIIPESVAAGTVITLTAAWQDTPAESEYKGITVNPTDNGTVKVLVNGVEATQAAEGQTVAVQATPSQGYQVDKIEVAAESGPVTVRSGAFTMPGEAVTVTVTFKTTAVPPTKYAITCEAAENGSVSADVTEAEAGAEVTLTVTPGSGYELDSLTVDGETVDVTGSTYTFPMPDHAVTVSATFKQTPSQSITVTYSEDETLETMLLGGQIKLENLDGGKYYLCQVTKIVGSAESSMAFKLHGNTTETLDVLYLAADSYTVELWVSDTDAASLGAYGNKILTRTFSAEG